MHRLWRLPLLLLVAALDRSAQAQQPSQRTRVGPAVDPRIVWPDPSTVDSAALNSWSRRDRAQISGSPVPVLLPKDPAVTPKSLIVKMAFYAYSASSAGVEIAIQGTRGAYQARGPVPAAARERVRNNPAVITQNDEIWSVSWIEGGAGYSIDVECAKAGDSRCANADFILSLVNGLVYLGGRQQ